MRKTDHELKGRYRQIHVGENHPLRPMSRHGAIRLHRFVVATYLGRPLLPSERVHHLNGVKLDNRLENLELINSAQHNNKRSLTTKRDELIGQIVKLTDLKRELTQEIENLQIQKGKLVTSP